jgi:hypothetical protein
LSTKNSSPQFTTVKEKWSRFANGGVFQQVLQQILGAAVILKSKSRDGL